MGSRYLTANGNTATASSVISHNEQTGFLEPTAVKRQVAQPNSLNQNELYNFESLGSISAEDNNSDRIVASIKVEPY